jgi:hypothetical protein
MPRVLGKLRRIADNRGLAGCCGGVHWSRSGITHRCHTRERTVGMQNCPAATVEWQLCNVQARPHDAVVRARSVELGCVCVSPYGCNLAGPLTPVPHHRAVAYRTSVRASRAASQAAHHHGMPPPLQGDAPRAAAAWAPAMHCAGPALGSANVMAAKLLRYASGLTGMIP